MFENPRRGRRARNFTTNVPKILDRKSSSEQIFSENCRWVPLKTETVVERWPFSRGLNKSQCLNCPPRKSGRCGEVAVQQIRRPVRDQSNHQIRNATLFTDRKTQTEIFNRTKELYHLRHKDLSGIFSIMESTP